MRIRLTAFLNSNDTLYDYQFGFRKHHNTTDALITITDRLYKCIDNGKYALTLFIDLKKEFDTVNHELLIKKLDHYGITGPTLNWIYDYLQNRSQYTEVNGYASKPDTISCGVPQGGRLSTLFYLCK